MQATNEDEEEEQEIEDEKEQEDDAQVTITVDLIAGQRVKEFQTTPIRNFTLGAVFALYLCYQFIFLTTLSGKYRVCLVFLPAGCTQRGQLVLQLLWVFSVCVCVSPSVHSTACVCPESLGC